MASQIVYSHLLVGLAETGVAKMVAIPVVCLAFLPGVDTISQFPTGTANNMYSSFWSPMVAVCYLKKSIKWSDLRNFLTQREALIFLFSSGFAGKTWNNFSHVELLLGTCVLFYMKEIHAGKTFFFFESWGAFGNFKKSLLHSQGRLV